VPFDRERAAFAAFRLAIDGREAVRQQMERAIAEVYWTYDTTLRENRFTVGGVVEFVVGAALRACGVGVRHKGTVDGDIDLLFDEGDVGYSIKAIFKGTGTRLVNTMGTAPTAERWQAATLFLLSGTGIVYADPALPWWVANRDRCIRPSGDAITVSKRCIVAFATEHQEWLAPCRLPEERDRPQRPHPARSHSADLAAQVLIHYPALLGELAGLRPGEEIPGAQG